MDTFCLVLTGEFATPDTAAAEARLAAAFGMAPDAFREKVWQRAPLIIRQGLAHDDAERQAAQLAELGARAEAHAEESVLIWLLRGERVLGPLPGSTRGIFARPGDRWCYDGDGSWQELPGSAAPPPLPRDPLIAPPPLPDAPSPRRPRRYWAWLGGAAAAVVLLGFWLHARTPAPATTALPVPYVPRPLQPLASTGAAANACPDATGAAPANDEDRFLLAGGRRQLTGRSQRQGDAYVAEAVVAWDAQCRPSAVQLYAFHRGVFVGTPMDAPLDPRRVQLVSFSLDAQDRLAYTVRRCDDRTGHCDPAETNLARLQPGDGGWVVVYGSASGDAAVEIVSRRPPRYPPEAVRQHHEGTVLLSLTIGADGTPVEVTVAQSSGFAELDAAALTAARQWRFRALAPDGHATTTTTRVPVRFHLDQSPL